MPAITHNLRHVRRLQLNAAIASMVLLTFAYACNRDGGSAAKNGRVLPRRTRSAGMGHALGHVDAGPPIAGQPCDRRRVGWSPRARPGLLREARSAVQPAQLREEDGG